MFNEVIAGLLQDDRKVRFSAPGHSMFPTIMANETVLVEPIEPSAVKNGDIILYRCNGNLIAHRVMAIVTQTAANDYSSLLQAFSAAQCESQGNNKKHAIGSDRLFILRGDAARSFDEPVEAEQILGKVVRVQRWGRSFDPYSFKHRVASLMFAWAWRIKSRLTPRN